MTKELNDYNNMPEKINSFWLYRKCYRDIWLRKKNVTFIVIGNTGSGKSEFALKVASDLDPTFNIERVVYDNKSFFELITKGDSFGPIGIGKAIVFDESSHDEAMDSRSAMSKGNKTMANFSTIFRAKRWIIIYVAPNLSQIDSRVRAISVTGVFQTRSIDYNRKLTRVTLYWSDQNNKSGQVYYKKPRIKKPDGRVVVANPILFGRPDKALRELYEKKKMAFIDAKIKKWNSEISAGEITKDSKVLSMSEIIAEVEKDNKKFMLGNKFNSIKLVEVFNIGISTAGKITSYLNKRQKTTDDA
jgi:hypothetical protein